MKSSVARMVEKFFGSIIFLFLIIASSTVTGCINYEAASRHLNYGMAYIETGQYTPALKELIEADKNNPRDPKIKYYLGVCYHGKGLAKEAIVEFKKAIAIKRDYSEAHNYLGLIYTDKGQLDDAIMEFQAALSNLLYETPSYAMSNLGWAYYKKGNYTAAMSQYQEVLNRDPDSPILPIVHRNIGIVLLAQGKYEQALSHLRKGLEIAPEFVPEQTHYWMGKVLAEQGKSKEAESEFQKSIQIAPNSKFAADSAAEIEKLYKKSDSPAVKAAYAPETEAATRPEDSAPPKQQPAAIAPMPEQKVAAFAKERPEEIVKPETVKRARPEVGPTLHTVKRGETIYSIARAYGLPVKTLCSANKKPMNYRVKVGERLMIPNSDPKSINKAKKEAVGEARMIKYHVRPGDSLTSVAKKFHTTMADIKKLNNLKRNTLDKGQVLKIRTTE